MKDHHDQEDCLEGKTMWKKYAIMNFMIYVYSIISTKLFFFYCSPWAIKKLSKAHATLDIAQRLDEEAKILKSLKHPNIIGYRGFKRSADGKFLVKPAYS